jgi:hypothetical protein
MLDYAPSDQSLGMLRQIREKKRLVPLWATSLWLHGDEPFA